MRIALNVLAALFLLLAFGAAAEAALAIAAFQAARDNAVVSRDQFVFFAIQMSFSWLFLSLYVAIAWGLWKKRKLSVVTLFLIVLVACSWLGTIYHKSAIVLAVVALLTLTFSRARKLFRD